jgi:hypothetical protein
MRAERLGSGPGAGDSGRMNLISILIGLIALFWAFFAFIPLFGWLYWGIVPVALVGLAFGVLSSKTGGRNLNLIVILVGIARLAIGHGIF